MKSRSRDGLAAKGLLGTFCLITILLCDAIISSLMVVFAIFLLFDATILQSNQVKHAPQDHINELVFGILNR